MPFIILRVHFKVYSELVMFGASVVDLHHVDDECGLTDDLGRSSIDCRRLSSSGTRCDI